MFLSDASNEEVVSVSKELMNGISSEIRSVNGSALALLGISVVSLVLMIASLFGTDISVTGGLKSVVFLTRVLAIAMLSMSAVISGMVISKASDASTISTLLWRNVREMADDDMAYEQIQAIKVSGMLMNTSKMLVKMAAIIIAIAGLCFGLGYILEMLSAYSYI